MGHDPAASGDDAVNAAEVSCAVPYGSSGPYRMNGPEGLNEAVKRVRTALLTVVRDHRDGPDALKRV